MLDILYHLFYCYNPSLIRESNTLTQKSKKEIEITNTGKKKNAIDIENNRLPIKVLGICA